MRLVRQENQGDWAGVVAHVSRMLTGIVRAAGAANFLLARPWEEDDINPFTEAAAKRDAGEAVARSASLDDALRLCREQRSEERRVGKECVSTCRSRWWPAH